MDQETSVGLQGFGAGISSSNKEMVDTLLRCKLVSERVAEAMMKVDRKDFVPANMADYAYHDIPLPIGYNQTISAPSIIGYMLTKLDVHPGSRVLEIGTGSGYQTALLCELAGPSGSAGSGSARQSGTGQSGPEGQAVKPGPKGKVVSVDRVFEFVKQAEPIFARPSYASLAHSLVLRVGDASCGWDEFKPYDRIIAGASYPEFPEDIIGQLKIDGIFMAPIGRLIQSLLIYYKADNRFMWDIPVMFVPMAGKCGYRE